MMGELVFNEVEGDN